MKKIMKRRNFIIFIFPALALYFVFLSNQKEPVANRDSFVAPEGLIYDVDKITGQYKAYKLDSVFKRYNKRGLFNGTVIYAENGREVFKGAYGYADFRKKDTLNTASSFQLASVSKMFTAAAIMILEEEGKLDYDDSITKFIPEFPYNNISIRLLLTHRSGLSRYMSLADKYWNINKPINNEQVVELYVKYKPDPYFKPNTGFHYCNTNYALLASVIERISGQTFDVFVKEKIFDPLGMSDSFVYNLNGDSVISYQVPVGVPGYKHGGRYARKMGNYYLNGVMGDKGVYSSVEDLLKFNFAFDNNNFFNTSTLEEAFTPGSPPYWKRKDNYGFGWRIRESMDSTAYHMGWWKGFHSYFIRDMKNNKAIIALSNTHKGISSQVFWNIIEEENDDYIFEVYSNLN